MEKTKNFKKKKIAADSEEVLSKEKEMLRKRVNSLIRRKRLMEVQKLLKNEDIKPWGRATQAKVCWPTSLAVTSILFFLCKWLCIRMHACMERNKLKNTSFIMQVLTQDSICYI